MYSQALKVDCRATSNECIVNKGLWGCRRNRFREHRTICIILVTKLISLPGRKRGGMMSGGSYDYAYYRLEEFIVQVKRSLDDDYDCVNATRNERKRLIAICKVVGDMMHDLEWLDSGDTCEDTFIPLFKKNIKKIRRLVREEEVEE